MKLQLALSGDEKYMQDDDVKIILDTISEKFGSTLAHQDEDDNSNFDIENRFSKLE
jgi:hypothetical protein